MKIDRIEVIKLYEDFYNIGIIAGHEIIYERTSYPPKEKALAEARYLARKLGCKLVLPEGK